MRTSAQGSHKTQSWTIDSSVATSTPATIFSVNWSGDATGHETGKQESSGQKPQKTSFDTELEKPTPTVTTATPKRKRSQYELRDVMPNECDKPTASVRTPIVTTQLRDAILSEDNLDMQLETSETRQAQRHYSSRRRLRTVNDASGSLVTPYDRR